MKKNKTFLFILLVLIHFSGYNQEEFSEVFKFTLTPNKYILVYY